MLPQITLPEVTAGGEALLRHPAVLAAAAIGIPNAHCEQKIMACVALKPSERCWLDEFCASATA